MKEDVERCRSLFRAVIFKAIDDARGADLANYTTAKKLEAIKGARAWLTEMSEDFIVTCELAELNPHTVSRYAVSIFGDMHIDNLTRLTLKPENPKA